MENKVDSNVIKSKHEMSGDSYTTPTWIKLLFENWFDPCTFSDGNLREADGLGDWIDKTFVNPPYSNPLPWVDKAIKEHKKGKTIALLLKLDVSTKYYIRLKAAGAHILLPNERVKFNGSTPAFSSMIAILDGKELKKTEKLIAEGRQKILYDQ